MDILWETDQELLLFIYLIGDNNYEIHNNEPNSCRKFPYIYSIINIRREVKNFFLIFIIFDIAFMFTYIMYIYNILLT